MILTDRDTTAWRRKFAFLPTIVSPTQRVWLAFYEERLESSTVHVLADGYHVFRRLYEGASEVKVYIDCSPEFAQPERRVLENE